MPYSTTTKLGAGSKLHFEPPASPGTFLLLDNALNIGQVGEQGEFVETTPISKEVRTYIRGLTTPPNKQITFNDTPGDPNYKAFLDAVDDKNVDNIKMRVDYKNGVRAEFVLVPNGRMMDEAQGNTQLQMIVFGQQSGITEWSEF